MGATINVKGTTYDIDKDFTWRELATVEDLSTIPLGRAGALDYSIVSAAFIYVVMKRAEPDLTWESYLDGGPSDVADDEPDDDEDAAAKPAARKPRPTRASA